MEGYEEIEILNPLNSGIMKVIKTCNNCQYKKQILVKSGKDPIYIDICSIRESRLRESRLYKNIYGYYEPPGFNGEECPFHQQLLREKTINNLLK